MMPARVPDDRRREIMLAALERLANGEYLHDICAEEGMPARSTLDEWMAADEEMRARRVRARALAAEGEEREVARIVGEVERGELLPDAARVAIHGRTWLAQVRDPERYGPRQKVEHSGAVKIVPVLTVQIAGPAPAVLEGFATEVPDDGSA